MSTRRQGAEPRRPPFKCSSTSSSLYLTRTSLCSLSVSLRRRHVPPATQAVCPPCICIAMAFPSPSSATGGAAGQALQEGVGSCSPVAAASQLIGVRHLRRQLDGRQILPFISFCRLPVRRRRVQLSVVRKARFSVPQV